MSWGGVGGAEQTEKKKKSTNASEGYAMKRNSHHGVKWTLGIGDILQSFHT